MGKLHLFELRSGHILLDGVTIRGIRECEFSMAVPVFKSIDEIQERFNRRTEEWINEVLRFSKYRENRI